MSESGPACPLSRRCWGESGHQRALIRLDREGTGPDAQRARPDQGGRQIEGRARRARGGPGGRGRQPRHLPEVGADPNLKPGQVWELKGAKEGTHLPASSKHAHAGKTRREIQHQPEEEDHAANDIGRRAPRPGDAERAVAHGGDDRQHYRDQDCAHRHTSLNSAPHDSAGHDLTLENFIFLSG